MDKWYILTAAPSSRMKVEDSKDNFRFGKKRNMTKISWQIYTKVK